AKQTTNATCRSFDSCWTFLGLVTRAAISMDLNRQPSPPNRSAEAIREWQSGQILWSLILYFCIHIATITGKLPLISANDLGMKQASFPLSPETTDPWIALLEIYPTICHIIFRVNNETEKPSYDEVQHCNDQVRHHMTLLDTIHGRPSLYVTLDIFFRRILLVIHRAHALHPRAPVDYP
ncbi:Fungal specific transcription factor domain-containing protein isoform 2, partial [Cladophialophora immunda]